MAERARKRRLLTPSEFMLYPEVPGKQCELVRGDLRMAPLAGGRHGLVVGNMYRLPSTHVQAHGLGFCFTEATGFELPNLFRTVRAPDVAFVRGERLPGAITDKFIQLAPDLAVEVLSPSTRAFMIDEKLSDYRAAGTPVVWLVDVKRRGVSVLDSDGRSRWLGESDWIDGGDVVGGFTCRVAAFFDGLPQDS